jgi:hypothetical protein
MRRFLKYLNDFVLTKLIVFELFSNLENWLSSYFESECRKRRKNSNTASTIPKDILEKLQGSIKNCLRNTSNCCLAGTKKRVCVWKEGAVGPLNRNKSKNKGQNARSKTKLSMEDCLLAFCPLKVF